MSVKLGNQVVGNIGLYYVCYRLARLGWNVIPTARNARGVDILVYSVDATKKLSVQVKALSKSNPVPLGTHTDAIFGDYFIVCRRVVTDSPECFVLTPTEVKALAHRGEKDGRVSYWLQPRDYAKDCFRDRWERIGAGA